MDNLLDHVNAFIGTHNYKRFSEGNSLPLTALPNALASFTIQNQTLHGFDQRWFFNPESRSFEGIRLTHQPSPWVGDYGQLLIIPADDGYLNSDSDTWFSSYRAKDLSIKPHHMSLSLAKHPISFHLAPTHSGGVLNLSYRSDKKHRVLLKGLQGTTNFWFNEKTGSIEGKTNSVDHDVPYELWSYFVIRCDKRVSITSLSNDMFVISFSEHELELKIATSFISLEQAYVNYDRELTESFDTISSNASRAWQEKLGKIIIEDDDERKKTMFYTSLYRVFLFPRKFYETTREGRNVHLHPQTGSIVEGKMYVDHGFWDTYRTVFPLFAIIDQRLYIDVLEGVHQYYMDTKKLPKWLSPNEMNYMPGQLIIPVIADAIVKGFLPQSLEEKLYTLILEIKDTYINNTHYIEHGYFPSEQQKESVNETLDAAYTDYCIFQVLKKHDHPDQHAFYKRSLNYKHLFDRETGFMRGKNREGSFITPFNPIRWGGDYTEGSAWQNSFGVYHDIEGLNALHNDKLENMIDRMFREEPLFDVGSYGIEIHEMSEMFAQEFGQCAISNQPSFHIPYIFAALGNTKKTYDKVKWIIEKAFLEEKYPGDEDNGSMSGWFIFSLLGFYPMCPGNNTYVTSFPLVRRAGIRHGEHRVIIDADKLNVDHMTNTFAYQSLSRHTDYKKIVEHRDYECQDEGGK